MNRNICIIMMSLIALGACSKSDKDDIPPLKKLTKVVCTKNSNPLYTININYTADGQINSIQQDGGFKQQFIYVGQTITINGLDNTTIQYTTKNNTISRQEISKENPSVSSETYISDEFVYNYNKSNLNYSDWLIRWPKQGGGYDTRKYIHTFTWEDGNIVRFIEDKKEMVYTYSSQTRPANFPIRVISSFSPKDFDIINPINFLFGNLSRELPTTAYWYVVPETTNIGAEYSFTYSMLGDYINTMIIEEKDFTTQEEGVNTYNFTFEYNYEAKI